MKNEGGFKDPIYTMRTFNDCSSYASAPAQAEGGKRMECPTMKGEALTYMDWSSSVRHRKVSEMPNTGEIFM